MNLWKLSVAVSAVAALYALTPRQASAESVFVDEGRGQGLVVQHRGNCFVILPKHVLTLSRQVDIGTSDPIATSAANIIEFETTRDLAVGRVARGFQDHCTEEWQSLSGNIDSLLSTASDAFLTVVYSSGVEKALRMRIVEHDLYTVTAEIESAHAADFERIGKGTSGGILRIDGAAVGMAITSTDTSHATFLRVDEIKAQLSRLLDAQADDIDLASKEAEEATARNKAELQIEQAERSLLDRSFPKAATLALGALEMLPSAKIEELRSRAAKVLYSSLLEIDPPNVDLAIDEAVPLEGGQMTLSALSIDGQYFALYAKGNRIKIYDVAAGRIHRDIEAPANLEEMYFTGEGRLFVIDREGQLSRLFVADTESTLDVIGAIGKGPRAFSFSWDGKLFLDLSKPSQLTIRSSDDRSTVLSTPLTSNLARVEFSRDNRLFAAAFEDRSIAAWDVKSGEQLWKMTPHGENFPSVKFSADGSSLLINFDLSGTPIVIDTKSWKQWPSLARRDKGEVTATCFLTDDGETLASAMTDRSITIWSSRTGEVIDTISSAKGDIYWLYSPSSDILVAQTNSETPLIAWRWQTGEVVAELKEDWDTGSYPMPILGRPELIVVRGNRLQSIALAPSQSTIRMPRLNDGFAKIAVTKDKKRIVTRSDQKLTLWNAETMQVLHEYENAGTFAFSGDESQILLGPGSERGGDIQLLSAINGDLEARFPGNRSAVTNVVFSRVSENVFYSAGIAEFFIGSLEGGIELRGEFYSKGPESMTELPSKDGPIVRAAIVGYAGDLSVAEIANQTARIIARLQQEGAHITSAFVDRPGEIVAALGVDNVVRVFRVSNSKEENSYTAKSQIESMWMNQDDSRELFFVDNTGNMISWNWLSNEIVEYLPEVECNTVALARNLRTCDNFSKMVLTAVLSGQATDVSEYPSGSMLVADGRFVRVDDGQFTKLYPVFSSLDAMVLEAKRRLGKELPGGPTAEK